MEWAQSYAGLGISIMIMKYNSARSATQKTLRAIVMLCVSSFDSLRMCYGMSEWTTWLNTLQRRLPHYIMTTHHLATTCFCVKINLVSFIVSTIHTKLNSIRQRTGCPRTKLHKRKFSGNFIFGHIYDISTIWIKPVWIGVFLYADSDGHHMTKGQNFSLESYRWKTAFSHVMSHVTFMNFFRWLQLPFGLEPAHFH